MVDEGTLVIKTRLWNATLRHSIQLIVGSLVPTMCINLKLRRCFLRKLNFHSTCTDLPMTTNNERWRVGIDFRFRRSLTGENTSNVTLSVTAMTWALAVDAVYQERLSLRSSGKTCPPSALGLDKHHAARHKLQATDHLRDNSGDKQDNEDSGCKPK